MSAKNYVEKHHLPALIERAEEYARGRELRDALPVKVVRAYMNEIIERAENNKVFPLVAGLTRAQFEKALLCGAPNWHRASAGGAFLVATEAIEARAGMSFSEDEPLEPAKWQACALACAARALFHAYSEVRAAHRQFYMTMDFVKRRREGGSIYAFRVYEYVEDTGRESAPRPGLILRAGGEFNTAGYPGDATTAYRALCREGVLTGADAEGYERAYFSNSQELNNPLGASFTIEAL